MNNMDHIRNAPVGRLAILVLASILLIGQLWIEYPYYRYRWWEDMTGFGMDTPAIYRFAPWWSLALASAAHFFALAFSWLKRGTLGWRWWYIALPIIAVAATLFVLSASTLDIVHHRFYFFAVSVDSRIWG